MRRVASHGGAAPSAQDLLQLAAGGERVLAPRQVKSPARAFR